MEGASKRAQRWSEYGSRSKTRAGSKWVTRYCHSIHTSVYEVHQTFPREPGHQFFDVRFGSARQRPGYGGEAFGR